MSLARGWKQLWQTTHAAIGVSVTKWQSTRCGLSFVLAYVDNPLVSGSFVVGTESMSNDGCPHTLEHLVFMGSTEFPHKGIIDVLSNVCLAQGTNAYTAVDHTAYEVETIGKVGFLRILPVFLDHILFPTLTEAAFLTEVVHTTGKGTTAGVVYSEMEGVEFQPENCSDYTLRQNLYAGTPYASETGGRLEDLRSLTLEDVRRYHERYYTDSNLTVIVCGRVEAQDMFAALEPIITKIEAVEAGNAATAVVVGPGGVTGVDALLGSVCEGSSGAATSPVSGGEVGGAKTATRLLLSNSARLRLRTGDPSDGPGSDGVSGASGRGVGSSAGGGGGVPSKFPDVFPTAFESEDEGEAEVDKTKVGGKSGGGGGGGGKSAAAATALRRALSSPLSSPTVHICRKRGGGPQDVGGATGAARGSVLEEGRGETIGRADTTASYTSASLPSPADGVRPLWHTPYPPLTESRTVTTHFPSSSSTSGAIIEMGWRAATGCDPITSFAWNLLTDYLAGTPICPLNKALVECEGSIAGDVVTYINGQAASSLNLEVKGVSVANVGEVAKKVRSTLSEAAKAVDMKRMRRLARAHVDASVLRMERSPHSVLQEAATAALLYGVREGDCIHESSPEFEVVHCEFAEAVRAKAQKEGRMGGDGSPTAGQTCMVARVLGVSSAVTVEGGASAVESTAAAAAAAGASGSAAFPSLAARRADEATLVAATLRVEETVMCLPLDDADAPLWGRLIQALVDAPCVTVHALPSPAEKQAVHAANVSRREEMCAKLGESGLSAAASLVAEAEELNATTKELTPAQWKFVKKAFPLPAVADVPQVVMGVSRGLSCTTPGSDGAGSAPDWQRGGVIVGCAEGDAAEAGDSVPAATGGADVDMKAASNNGSRRGSVERPPTRAAMIGKIRAALSNTPSPTALGAFGFSDLRVCIASTRYVTLAFNFDTSGLPAMARWFLPVLGNVFFELPVTDEEVAGVDDADEDRMAGDPAVGRGVGGAGGSGAAGGANGGARTWSSDEVYSLWEGLAPSFSFGYGFTASKSPRTLSSVVCLYVTVPASKLDIAVTWCARGLFCSQFTSPDALQRIAFAAKRRRKQLFNSRLSQDDVVRAASASMYYPDTTNAAIGLFTHQTPLLRVIEKRPEVAAAAFLSLRQHLLCSEERTSVVLTVPPSLLALAEGETAVAAAKDLQDAMARLKALSADAPFKTMMEASGVAPPTTPLLAQMVGGPLARYAQQRRDAKEKVDALLGRDAEPVGATGGDIQAGEGVVATAKSLLQPLLPPATPLPPLPYRVSGLLHPERLSYRLDSPLRAMIVTAAAESAAVHHSVPGPLGDDHPHYPALLVCCHALTLLEGRLWGAVRGPGLAYGMSLGVNTARGSVTLGLSSCTRPAAAYVAALRAIASAVAAGVSDFVSDWELQCARSSVVVELVPTSIGMVARDATTYASQGLCPTHTTSLLEKVLTVPKADVYAALSYLMPLCAPLGAWLGTKWSSTDTAGGGSDGSPSARPGAGGDPWGDDVSTDPRGGFVNALPDDADVDGGSDDTRWMTLSDARRWASAVIALLEGRAATPVGEMDGVAETEEGGAGDTAMPPVGSAERAHLGCGAGGTTGGEGGRVRVPVAAPVGVLTVGGEADKVSSFAEVVVPLLFPPSLRKRPKIKGATALSLKADDMTVPPTAAIDSGSAGGDGSSVTVPAGADRETVEASAAAVWAGGWRDMPRLPFGAVSIQQVDVAALWSGGNARLPFDDEADQDDEVEDEEDEEEEEE